MLEQGCLLTRHKYPCIVPSMPTRKPSHPKPLNRDELRFWCESFVAYEMPTALRHGTKITPIGQAHLAADFADSAINELRLRFRT